MDQKEIGERENAKYEHSNLQENQFIYPQHTHDWTLYPDECGRTYRAASLATPNAYNGGHLFNLLSSHSETDPNEFSAGQVFRRHSSANVYQTQKATEKTQNLLAGTVEHQNTQRIPPEVPVRKKPGSVPPQLPNPIVIELKIPPPPRKSAPPVQPRARGIQVPRPTPKTSSELIPTSTSDPTQQLHNPVQQIPNPIQQIPSPNQTFFNQSPIGIDTNLNVQSFLANQSQIKQYDLLDKNLVSFIPCSSECLSRRYSFSHTGDIKCGQKNDYSTGKTGAAPPRPDTPPPIDYQRKFSEGNVPIDNTALSSGRRRSFKIPPPIETRSTLLSDLSENDLNQSTVSDENINEKTSMRQDSNVSSDGYSQTSSPSYNVKSMETPLLPRSKSKQQNAKKSVAKSINLSSQDKIKCSGTRKDNAVSMSAVEDSNSPLTKSHSTPASLQAVVRFHHGSNMSLHHRIIRDIRRPSSHYISRRRLHFQCAQIIVNALALLAIVGGFLAYFNAYPVTIKYVNKTVTTNYSTTQYIMQPTNEDLNPAPGICLPLIVKFCQLNKVPYNYTVFPNYVGHFNQILADNELELYVAIVNVRCYELAAFFLCTLFAPKCGPAGNLIRPCKPLCDETIRRCGFFLEVFGLLLPEYLNCNMFPDSVNPDTCIGYRETQEEFVRSQEPVCVSGFQCDQKRCIPQDYRCDGHVDCEDKNDELDCQQCKKGMIHCGSNRCISITQICDGIVDCPYGQDERNCIRLSNTMGDEGEGNLEIYQPENHSWRQACVTYWDSTSATEICSVLGYSISKAQNVTSKKKATNYFADSGRRRPYNKKGTLLRELKSCNASDANNFKIKLACSEYICGTRKHPLERPLPRIVGGVESTPGDWPFLAALLGGPEQIFYCAGVLISDQWVLTASHCVGNFTSGDPSGWTIQLGITRRDAHSYFGQKMKIQRVISHPLYNVGVPHDNDIALFQLKSRVEFHEHLVPVCLPPPNYDLAPGTVCTVIGWGKTEDSHVSGYEAAVNEVQVPVLNRDLCNTWLGNPEINITKGMICAGYPEGGKDACQGDSGGPLLCNITVDGEERWFVGGIVSWGVKCAHPHLPGVYAYVPAYVDWIQKEMEKYSRSDEEF